MAKGRKKAAAREPRKGVFAHIDEMRPRIGRPTYKPSESDRRFVTQMSALGMTQDEMSIVVGIDRNTLAKHFREEIDGGKIEANAAVAAAMFRKATSAALTGPSVRAAEFWLRARAGWVYAESEQDKKKSEGQTFVLRVERD